MKNTPTVLTMDIPVPLPVFMALCEYKEKSGSKQPIHQMAGEALQQWLSAQRQRAIDARAPSALQGYQWKDLFLPHGTLLRAVLDKKNIHATVEGDQILFNGRAVSPSRFVNEGGTARNAWTTIWLLFPRQSVWRRAADCRAIRPSRKSRSSDPGAQAQ